MTHRSTRLSRWILLLAAACMLLGFGPGAESALAAEKVIKIGTIFPLTGPVALAGQRCKAAVETAVEILNNRHPEIKVPLADKKGWLQGLPWLSV